MNIDVPVADARRIEVVANGLPLWHGSQLALDATIVSPVTRSGEADPRAHTQPGWAANNAARRKRRDTYSELTRARRCRLVVIGIEVGGRFGDEAATFLRLLARQRAAAVPAHRPAELPLAGEVNGDEAVPDLPELLADARGELPVLASRLPARPL